MTGHKMCTNVVLFSLALVFLLRSVTGAQWSYAGKTGPEYWGGLCMAGMVKQTNKIFTHA